MMLGLILTFMVGGMGGIILMSLMMISKQADFSAALIYEEKLVNNHE